MTVPQVPSRYADSDALPEGADEADVVEQRREAVAVDEEAGPAPVGPDPDVLADPADLAEQALEVEYDDEDRG